jgi:hypothetical protein
MNVGATGCATSCATRSRLCHQEPNVRVRFARRQNEPLTHKSRILRHFGIGEVAEWLKAAVC